MAALPPFEHVIDAHGPSVLRVCIAHAGPRLADDVFQETMIAALRAYPDLSEPAVIRSWLCTIAERKAIDALRAERRRPRPTDPGELPETATGGEDLPDPWPAVRTLPDKQRAAVTLRYLGGLKHSEVAAVLGISAAAARRNASDGLARLRAGNTEETDA